jgi:c-di-GMP-binding flagellar brake protein YcgR
MAVIQQGEMIFKRVAVSEKKLIFRELADDKSQVTCKGAEREGVFHLIAIQIEKDAALLCHHTEDSKEITQPQKVLMNFSFKTERYFMQTELSFEVGWAVMDISGDLFQLQRRANARFVMPPEYGAVYILMSHEGKKYFLDCPLKDISAGGFKMEVPATHPDFRMGEVLKGSLRLGQRRPMEFETEVRFVQKNPEGVHVLGVQFLNIDHVMENRLLSLMMDLQRELYLKYSKK